jgi:hypothetical protein
MGYGSAPWEFRGQALYQLSLVRSEEVRGHRCVAIATTATALRRALPPPPARFPRSAAAADPI